MIRRLNLRVLLEIVLWLGLLAGLSGSFLILHEQILVYALFVVISILVLRVAVAFVIWKLFTVLVEPYERLVISRRGQPYTICGPGDVVVIPFRDKAIRVGLREQPLSVPVDLVCFTQDPAELAVTVDIFWNVEQPV
jgi:regulator of protease activity HflC (stomatin/prohibitin superfamily)